MQFQPAELLVNKGDTVFFINRDIVVHDVTEKNRSWASSPLSTDHEYSMVVKNDVEYYCSIHPVMKGKLRVQ
jgi:plastocyanin